MSQQQIWSSAVLQFRFARIITLIAYGFHSTVLNLRWMTGQSAQSFVRTWHVWRTIHGMYRCMILNAWNMHEAEPKNENALEWFKQIWCPGIWINILPHTWWGYEFLHLVKDFLRSDLDLKVSETVLTWVASPYLHYLELSKTQYWWGLQDGTLNCIHSSLCFDFSGRRFKLILDWIALNANLPE